MKSKKKKDREYMPILDQPIEKFKKPIGQPVDFDKAITEILGNKYKNTNSRHP